MSDLAESEMKSKRVRQSLCLNPNGTIRKDISTLAVVCFTLAVSAVWLVDYQQPAVSAPSGGQRTKTAHGIHLLSYEQSPVLTDAQLFEEVTKQHPLNRLQCGNWAERYTQLHKDILQGKAPQRFTVMRSKQEFGNGLADRLATSVTIFLYALLTDRAFLYDWDPPPDAREVALQQEVYGRYMFFEPPTHLWTALRSDFIDWRYKGPVGTAEDTVVMDYNCDKDTDVYKDFFAKQDVSTLMDQYQTVVWHADHAMVWAAFDNPFLKDKLEALGLQRDTAFACLFDYLYRPTPPVLQLFKTELQTLLDPKVLKIGVQIRVGDWQLCDSQLFKPQQYPSLFDHYFQCAWDIEKELAQPNQRVVWYTLSDIPELRRGLADRHPSRILVNTDVSVEHVVKTRNATERGFLQAAGELWAFSLTTAHVITRKSGFGKVPAMVNANGTQHIFSIDYPMRFGWFGLDNRKNVGWSLPRTCTTKHASPLSKVCTDFTGI